MPSDYLTDERLVVLIETLAVDGALPALRVLIIHSALTHSSLDELADAMGEGMLPNIEELSLLHICDRQDVESLVCMLALRARIPGCKRLRSFEVNSMRWIDNAFLPTRIHLLDVLLPSVSHLPEFVWCKEY